MTKYGICELSVVPVRKQPSDKSEIINQLLFGDLVIIEELQAQWLLIKSSHDKYEGWIDNKQVRLINESECNEIEKSTLYFLNAITGHANCENGEKLCLVMGSKMPNYTLGNFRFSDKSFSIEQDLVTKQKPADKRIIETALKYLGSPYLWGGRSPFGIDCSGFVQIVFGMHGISLPRDAYQQAETGKTIDFISESTVGDLAYFDNEEDNITHVGIILDEKKILHASGEVRIDNIDHHGIYNEQLKKYTHKLRIIKRLIG